MSESRLIQYLIAVPDGKASKKGKLLKAHAGKGIIKSWDIDGATIHGWIDGSGSAELHERQVEALERIAAEQVITNQLFQMLLFVLDRHIADEAFSDVIEGVPVKPYDLDVDKEK
jgi:hypothetical protein